MSWFRNYSPPQSTGPTLAEEEAGKAAILEKVMKGRQPTDLMLRCTVLDAEGNVKTISGQFKKSDLSAEHQLNPRDLRKIDSRVPNLVPTILVRKEAFLHNLKTKGSGLPYEFRALESILLSVLSALEAELVFIRNLVGGLLAELEDDIDHDRFKRLLHYSRRLASFQSRAKLVMEALEEVLEQDEDLVAMYLSDKKNGTPRNLHDHEDLEVLLETFSKQVEEIVNEVDNIESNVQSTQEIVELILDSNRNALLALDLQVSIATFGVGTGALIAGFFGMNLTNHMESHPYAFFGMTFMSGTLAFLASYALFRKLAKIRKIGLSRNNGSRRPRRPWLPLPLRRRGGGGEGEGWF
ncbi:magnesium ion transporter [Paramarasmius palmivorus]|uniref:Magnesium transporter n=1 Tax=Paramarasmius palmivorus TaxID=297713 RepID=A0AAW0D853_9AGAR